MFLNIINDETPKGVLKTEVWIGEKILEGIFFLTSDIYDLYYGKGRSFTNKYIDMYNIHVYRMMKIRLKRSPNNSSNT